MSLFKDVYCADCKEKTNILFRTKLKDKNYLCSKCMKKVPSYMKDTFKKEYTFENYKDFKNYIDYANQYLRPIFHETHEFHGIHIDTDNQIFYIGYGVDENTLFLNFANLADFDLVFKAEEFKESIIGSAVKGDIVMGITMTNPFFQHEEILVYGAKAKARKALFGATVKYENPKGMDFFIDAFACAWEEALDKDNEEYCDYDEIVVNATPSELQQAMALFMIDNLDDMTLSSLKLHRNRLMQTFHPDTGSADDTKYAQKINKAYEVLKKTISDAEQQK